MTRQESGMTLVEVVIATVILGWLTVGMFTTYHSTQQLMARANRNHYALILAREKLEELLGVGFQGLTGPPYNFNGTTHEVQTAAETNVQIQTSYGADVNEFITRYLIKRETKLQNRFDWTQSSQVDFRKIEVIVYWNEPVA